MLILSDRKVGLIIIILTPLSVTVGDVVAFIVDETRGVVYPEKHLGDTMILGCVYASFGFYNRNGSIWKGLNPETP